MKEALVNVTSNGETIAVKIVDSPIPQPSSTQVLIKVEVSGSNPKDWKVPMWLPQHNDSNTGDDIAGIVHAVGSLVNEFRVGDRVAAFHQIRSPAGSYAEYAVAEEHTTFHLPAGVSFEEGASIPLAAMTAALGLFVRLGVPEPWVTTRAEREKMKGGIVVYGAAGAVGAFAIKLLRKTDVHPIIAVAGRGKDFVEKLIDRGKGDTIVDYRQDDDKIVQGIKDGVAEGQKLRHAFDAVSDHGSYQNIAKVLDPHGHLTVVLPGKTYDGVPDTVNLVRTGVGSSHDQDKDFACAWYRLLGRGLKDGWFSGHPTETMPGGLEGLEQGLKYLRDGKASAVKYVYRISDTPGVGSSVIA